MQVIIMQSNGAGLRFWFQRDIPADIPPHSVLVRFHKIESGTSLKLTLILTLYARLIPPSNHAIRDFTKSQITWSYI